MYKLTHTFICDVCNKQQSVSYEMSKYQPQTVNFPTGWSELPQGYICDDVIITITDKEEQKVSE